MSDINILNSKKKENFILKLESYYNCNLDNLRKFYFYLNEKTNKINIANFNINELDLNRINNFGIYFGTYHNNERFRLSLEGSKFINPKNNFIKLNEKGFKNYIAGENITLDEVEKFNWQDNCPFLIVLYNDDKLGSMNKKDDMFLTYLPKSRKLDYGKVF
jgi:NOL1/NOP2/fmu family ribosome biogenesis protein